MSVSLYNIRKWAGMLTGRSILHVDQGAGKLYSKSEMKGYYNDLTEKVTKNKELNADQLPVYQIKDGSKILFPIMIFQYGLGAYDLFLTEKNPVFLEIFRRCADWSLDNQQADGSWNAFFFIYPDAPFSAMAQGEGISLLLRAFQVFRQERYLIGAQKAAEFMILPVESGGTAEYNSERIVFKEYTNSPAVLNGWIFSLFGLYDYLIVVYDEKFADIFERSVRTLIHDLPFYDNGYWSKYDADKILASPFYHRLHLSQLQVLHDLTREKVFLDYCQKWKAYQNNKINFFRAFAVKAAQKIKEK